MKNSSLVAILFAICLTCPCRAQTPGQIFDELVDKCVSRLSTETLANVRDKPAVTLSDQLGKPGFMAVVNGINVESIPEWALNTREILASCVVEATNARIKGQPFDLLGCLEHIAYRYDTSVNIPYFYNLYPIPKGYDVGHILFKARSTGEITALYIASNSDGERILVIDKGGSWRSPTSDESRRILKERRAIKLAGIVDEQ